jgi:hypothetical protein
MRGVAHCMQPAPDAALLETPSRAIPQITGCSPLRSSVTPCQMNTVTPPGASAPARRTCGRQLGRWETAGGSQIGFEPQSRSFVARGPHAEALSLSKGCAGLLRHYPRPTFAAALLDSSWLAMPESRSPIPSESLWLCGSVVEFRSGVQHRQRAPCLQPS